MIKSWPCLDKLPTSAVVIVLSLVLCPLTLVMIMAYLNQPMVWYMIVACVIVAFLVALVAMGGWEKISEIWQRTKYKKGGGQ